MLYNIIRLALYIYFLVIKPKKLKATKNEEITPCASMIGQGVVFDELFFA